MLLRLAVLLALTSALATTGCTTATPDKAKVEAGPRRPTTFESWSAGNGTGAFFQAVGPAGGSGVRSAWPQ